MVLLGGGGANDGDGDTGGDEPILWQNAGGPDPKVWRHDHCEHPIGHHEDLPKLLKGLLVINWNILIFASNMNSSIKINKSDW